MPSKPTIKFVLLALFTLSVTVKADVSAEAGKVAYQACISCHGASGEGNPQLNAPALAAQNAAYLARQLEHFKNGVRGGDPKDTYGAQMRAMVGTLVGPEAINSVSKYLSELPSTGGAADAAEFDRRNGANQYNGYCGACHGAKAEGNPILNAPRLAGLDIAYLKRQMMNFQNGTRGAADDDRYGKQMAMMAGTLPEKDLDDVLGFIQASSTQK